MTWNKLKIGLNSLNEASENTMARFLDIQFTEITDQHIKATMPVCAKTHQPAGLLHGGASAALAETVGSVASWLTIDQDRQMCVGIEIILRKG